MWEQRIMMGKERGIMFGGGQEGGEVFVLLVVFVSSLPLWFHKFLFYNNLLSCILLDLCMIFNTCYIKFVLKRTDEEFFLLSIKILS